LLFGLSDTHMASPPPPRVKTVSPYFRAVFSKI
jgi:hypothetical protein